MAYRVPRHSKEARRQTLVARSIGLVLLWGLVCVMAFIADRTLPIQTLPWKPLALIDPVGLATRTKATLAGADPVACRAVLRQGGLAFDPVPESRSGDFCAHHDAIKLTSGMARLNPEGPPMTCKQALALTIWERQIVQPAAFDLMGQAVVRIDHFGSYSCRRMYGKAAGPVSQHATANALDVARFHLADGQVISVARDWKDKGPKGQFLHRIRDGACRVFVVTLSPDYNSAHADHLHLDMGTWPVCG